MAIRYVFTSHHSFCAGHESDKTVSSEISYSEVSHCLQEKSNFTFSKMLATAKIDDGDTSSSFLAIDLSKFSAVSLRPSLTSQNLSVFAVHKTITCKRQEIGHCPTHST